MRVITPKIETLADYHSLIQHWERIGYEQIKLTPYKTLSAALRQEVCQNLGLSVTLPPEADIGALHNAIEGGKPHQIAASNTCQMSTHHAVLPIHEQHQEMISFMLFRRIVGSPVLAISVGEDWSIIFDER